MNNLLRASARMTISNNDMNTRDHTPFPEFGTVCALTGGVTEGGLAPGWVRRSRIMFPCECKFVMESVVSVLCPCSVVGLSGVSSFLSSLPFSLPEDWIFFFSCFTSASDCWERRRGHSQHPDPLPRRTSTQVLLHQVVRTGSNCSQVT